MLTLYRTGSEARFEDIFIGCAFFAHGEFWTRCGVNEATQVLGSDHVGKAVNFEFTDTIERVTSKPGSTSPEANT